MKPLLLSGRAEVAAGFEDQRRAVFRLRHPDGVGSHSDAAMVRTSSDLSAALSSGYSTVLLIGDAALSTEVDKSIKSVRVGEAFAYLADGDIVGFNPRTLRLRTLYRRASKHNSFLITERCNHFCLMCSQPPRNVDDAWIIDEIAESIPLIDPSAVSIGLTGGEPLLQWDRFIPLIAQFRDALPNTRLHVLTNGRYFADPQVARAWAEVRHPSLCAAIPIYSSVDAVHDHVVQSRGALDETLLGILRLKDRQQRIEVRIVLHALTIPGLVETCRWLARNLPFIDHVALMGLEYTGFVLANQDMLWIDPVDYQNQLGEAVGQLTDAGMECSIYNLPRCVLRRDLWPFAVQSISDWKNAYLEACEGCAEKPNCAGFFSTGRPRFSRSIRAIQLN